MNIKTNLKFNIKYILYFILILPFIRTRTMEDFPGWLQSLYNYLALISSAFMVAYALLKNNINKIKTIFPIILMMITYIIITLFNNIQALKGCYNCIFLIAIALFVNIELHKKPYDIIKILAFIYTTLILLNNILVVLFPKGFYHSVVSYHNGHLLGDDNAIIYVALPGMIILSIYSLLKNGKISKFTWFNIFFCEFVFIKLWAASAIIAFGIFIILIIIGTKFVKLPPIKLLIALIAFCAIVFVGLNLTIITNFVTNYLQKDITFSGRTYLWEHAFNMIAKRPLFGYGGFFVMGRSYLNGRLYPVHTTHLQILVDGGIVLFIEYIVIILLAFKKMNQYRNANISQVLCAGLIAIGVSYTFEQAGLYHFIILITIALNIDKLINYKKKSIDNENKIFNVSSNGKSEENSNNDNERTILQ